MQTSRSLLARTPPVLNALLRDLPDDLATASEGADTWSPFDVVGHLIQGERNDWIPRVEHLLKHGATVPFEQFDRFAQFDASKKSRSTNCSTRLPNCAPAVCSVSMRCNSAMPISRDSEHTPRLVA